MCSRFERRQQEKLGYQRWRTVLTGGTTSRLVPAERSTHRPATSEVEVNSPRYHGVPPWRTLCQHGMCVCVFSLLCERRILITSRRLGRLTACVHAAAALIYPLYWRVSSLCSAFRLLLRHGGGIVKIRLDVIQK